MSLLLKQVSIRQEANTSNTMVREGCYPSLDLTLWQNERETILYHLGVVIDLSGDL